MGFILSVAHCFSCQQTAEALPISTGAYIVHTYIRRSHLHEANGLTFWTPEPSPPPGNVLYLVAENYKTYVDLTTLLGHESRRLPRIVKQALREWFTGPYVPPLIRD